MKVVIVRRVRGSTASIDIYADNLASALRTVRPEWTIVEVEPTPWNSPDKLWMSGSGLRKYHECYWRYPRAVSKMEADIFHIVDHTDGHIARRLRRTGQSAVVTCHDLVQAIQPDRQSRFPALSLAVWRYAVTGMREANHVIAVSSNTAKDIHKLLNIPSECITVALNGVGPEFRVLSPAAVVSLRQQYTPSPETICLLNVGGTSQRKNILTVLKVVASLRDRGFPICLWKTGAQFTPQQQAFIAEHQIDRQIVHLGSPDKETLVSLYNAADILLSPSLYEGFGLTVVEAMACGTPVITSNVSSLPEVIGTAAIALEPTDVEGIVSAVINLKTDPDRYKFFSNEGLNRSNFFKWETTAERVANVYEKVLTSHQSWSGKYD